MTASRIEWTERSDWNPVRGCTRVSEGCRHCYAEQIAGRFSGEGQPFHGFARRQGGEGRWTGRVELVEDRLTLPLRWRKPATVFASSTSDIFHESLPDEAIDRLFAVMALAPQHRFQVLTKRSARMRAYLSDDSTARCDGRGAALIELWNKLGTPLHNRIMEGFRWPLPNVWLGVSVEDQAAADARVPDLLATPAALRFLSCEPLLGPVNIIDAMWAGDDPVLANLDQPIDWVIAGGESGRGARPMHPDWARSLRDQCAAAGVPFFFKQWGAHLPAGQVAAITGPWNPSCGSSLLTTKANAGRLLDGVEHSGMPA